MSSLSIALADRTFEVRTANRLARTSLRALVRPAPRPDDVGPVTPLELDAHLADDATTGVVLTTTLRLAAPALFPGHVLVHAAAVAAPIGGVLFVGGSGVGKTTIAVAAARLGLPVLADDVACVRVADRVIVPAPVRMRVRPATARVLAPPRRVPRAQETPLRAIVLLGAGRRSTARVLGTEALVSELPAMRRWDAACALASLLDGTRLVRLPRLALDDAAGVERAFDRMHGLFSELGVAPGPLAALFGVRRSRRPVLRG